LLEGLPTLANRLAQEGLDVRIERDGGSHGIMTTISMLS
jgi:hypothetical protein